MKGLAIGILPDDLALVASLAKLPVGGKTSHYSSGICSSRAEDIFSWVTYFDVRQATLLSKRGV